jgi:hypothetical protein
MMVARQALSPESYPQSQGDHFDPKDRKGEFPKSLVTPEGPPHLLHAIVPRVEEGMLQLGGF